MTIRSKDGERGQVLAIFAAGLLALLVAVGVVIDGGNAMAQQRDTQNGADAASEAGTTVIAQYLMGGSSSTGATAMERGDEPSGLGTLNSVPLRPAIVLPLPVASAIALLNWASTAGIDCRRPNRMRIPPPDPRIRSAAASLKMIRRLASTRTVRVPRPRGSVRAAVWDALTRSSRRVATSSAR